MSIRSLVAGSLVAGLSLLTAAGAAHAAQSVAITPAFAEASVKKGATFTQKFTIANGTDTRLRYTTSVSDYWSDASNTRVTGRPGTLPHSAAAWVQFSPTEIVVEPNTSATVAVLVTVPATAAGGYYAMCLFRADPAEATVQTSSSARIAIQLGAPLLLSVAGASRYDVAVLGGQVAPPTKTSELEANLDVVNRGDAHARLTGMFAILDAGGRLAGRGRIEEKRFFPDQHDTYRVPWAGELAPGAYTMVITLRYERAGAGPGTMLYELPFDVAR